MALSIQHNLIAANSYHRYNNNTSALGKTMEKLSSGYRINRAGDDAAGLAISEKMRAQITGLEVAQKNAKDGISLVQTAEGALDEVHSMLNRMYELAEQSANGTYSNEVDRVQLQKEVDSLKTEIDRVADSSNFNGIKLLDGSLSVGGSANGLSGGGGASATLTDTTNVSAINMGSSSATGAVEFGIAAQGDGSNAIVTVKVGSTTYTSAETAASGSLTLTNSADSTDTITVSLSSAGQTALSNAIGAFDTDSDVALAAIGNVGGGTAGLSAGGAASGPLTLQIGDDSQSWNQMKVSIDDVHVAALGTYTVTPEDSTTGTPSYKTTSAASGDPSAPTTIADIDISTQAGAAAALDVIKTSINYVSDTRGGLGAIQNRLEHTLQNLSVQAQNMQSAEATIRDTDMASEMMKLTTSNILMQASQAMLAQGNQQPQSVLQLLQ